MIELSEAIEAALNERVYKFILSNPASGDGRFRKITANRLAAGWGLEKYTPTQVFHETIAVDRMQAYLCAALQTDFRQYNSWDGEREYSVKVSAKGKVLASNHGVANAPKAAEQHNRVKNYLLPEGMVIPPLVDMGVFTPEGRVVRSMYDKYRQINRFIEIIDDELAGRSREEPLTVIDFGCGKSYLTFVLYYYLTEIRKQRVQMTGLDLKPEVIEKCGQTARRYGYDGLTFQLGDINGYRREGRVDMVVTLHACDTATDYALYNAICWNTELIFSVPCCQHELNGQIASDRLSILTRYGIVKERVAALMTDALRANLLEYCGYRTQLLEFVDLAHTPKNILIRAVRKKGPATGSDQAMAEAEALIDEFRLDPTLYRLVKEMRVGKA